MIEVTPKAIEKIRQAFAREGVSGALRLAVIGGGCSGLSYSLKFETGASAGDQVYEFGEVKIVVDPKSLLFLDGMTLDYQDSLLHSGFVFQNPHAQKSCSCGSSFAA